MINVGVFGWSGVFVGDVEVVGFMFVVLRLVMTWTKQILRVKSSNVACFDEYCAG